MEIKRNDAEALIPKQTMREIIQGVVKESRALAMFRKLPDMTSGRTEMRILDSLPITYWQTSDTATKKLTKMAWDKKYIYAEELAVIVPISENTLDDSEYDIWGEVQPRLIEAFGKKIDEAIFTGKDKPAKFRADLLTSVRNAGSSVSWDSDKTLYSHINDAMTKVEESGFEPSGIVGGVDMKGKFRMMLDDNGQPIRGTEIDELPKAYVDTGAWDKDKAQLIVGDMDQAVYAIRQDITFKVLDQAVIQDPSSGEILYNLPQQDMVALRVTMRLGWEIPNPINALEEDSEVRFPFALIEPAEEPDTYEVTMTVKDNGTAIEDAKVSFAGMEKETGADGKVTFKVNGNTDYIYSVSKSGYDTKYGEVSMGESDITITVKLGDEEEPALTEEVTFKVTDGDPGDPVENADVTVGQTTKSTNSDGEAVFYLEQNTSHLYSVKKDGIDSVYDEVEVEESSVTEEIKNFS